MAAVATEQEAGTGRLEWLHGYRARLVAAASVLVGLALVLVLRQLDVLLHAMHVPATQGSGVQDLADLGLRVPSSDRPETVLATWDEYALQRGDGPSPRKVANTYVWLDFGFIVVYGLALGLLLLRSRRRVAELGGPTSAYARVAFVALLAVPALVAADVSENVATFVAFEDCTGTCSSVTFIWLVASAVAKSLLAVAIVLALVVVASVGQTAGLGRTLVVLRIPVAIVVFLALLLLGPFGQDQLADVIRRWASLDHTDAIAAFGFSFWLGFLLLAIARRLLELDGDEGNPASANLGVLAALGVGSIAAGIAWWYWLDGGGGLIALGAILLAVVVLSLPLLSAPVPPMRHAGGGTVELPSVLGAAPLALLGLAVVQASVVEIAFAAQARYWLLVVFGAGALLVSALLYAVSYGPFGAVSFADHELRRFLALSLLLSGAVAIAVWINPWVTGDKLGVLGSAAAFLIGAAVLGYVLQRVEYLWLPPPFLFPFQVRRMPVLAMVAVSAVLAAFLDQGGYHDVRRLDPSREARAVTIEQAWTRWLESQNHLSGASERRAVPLVFVAAEGGGIRAAYWAARVLDCALEGSVASCGYAQEGEPGSLRSVFAVSGASGGSLGLLAAVVAQMQGERRPDWVDDRLGDDYLAATSAQTLFADIPNALLKLNLGPDRAAVLEQAWERSWGGEEGNPLAAGFLAAYARSDRMPLVIMSGTSVHDGCRVNTSPLDADVEQLNETLPELRVRDCLSLDPFGFSTPMPAADRNQRTRNWVFRATHDLVDELCTARDDGAAALEDIRFSTAALLSARFPYVSPSGRLTRCRTDSATFVVDGGYFDNTGASPLLELWENLEPRVNVWNATHPERCIVPVFLHVDNHTRAPARSDTPGRPLEVLVPPAAAGSSRVGHESNARQGAAAEFRGRFGPYVQAFASDKAETHVIRHVYVYPRSQPGTDAPLGWALSQASMTSLTKQLRGHNVAELAKVRRWFSPTLRCSR